jgi:lysophospholipid hydrolase
MLSLRLMLEVSMIQRHSVTVTRSQVDQVRMKLMSGIWGMFNHYNPFSKIPDVPTLSDIQSRLAYATSVPALEKAKASPGVLYMQPPVQQYGTLDFGKFDEIYEVGYQYCKTFLDGLRKEGKLENLVSGSLRHGDKRRGAPRLGRRQSI